MQAKERAEDAMSETEITTETTEPEVVEETQEAPELGDAGEKALKAEREARRAAEKSARDAKKATADALARVKEFEDRDKTETQKAAERIAALEQALAEKDSVISAKDREAERAKIAAAKGVPANLVTGNTPEEMEASAEAALDWAGTGRKPIGALRSGASANNSADPKEKAAQAIRSLSANR